MKNKYNLQVFTEKDTYFDILNKCNHNYIDHYKTFFQTFKNRRINNNEFGIYLILHEK